MAVSREQLELAASECMPTGFVPYDLVAPANVLYPTYSSIRNNLSRLALKPFGTRYEPLPVDWLSYVTGEYDE